MSRLRVVHVSTAHPPFDTRVFEKECSTLAAAGYEVVLLVPHDREEIRSDVLIRPLKRPRSRLDRFVFAPWRAFRAARRERGAVYHLHDPELMPVGVVLSWLGHNVVLDVHENVPLQVLDRDWIPSSMQRLISAAVKWAERVCVRFVSAVVSPEPEAARRFPPDKVTLIYNYPTLDGPLAEEPPARDRRDAAAAYVGSITHSRGAMEMVRAIGEVNKRGMALRLRLGGSIDPVLEEELTREPGWIHTDALGWLERGEVYRLLTTSALGLLLLHPTEKYLEAIPVKLFEYMAAGLPVVVSELPILERYVVDTGAGIMVNALDRGAVAEAIIWLIDHPSEAEEMGRRGRAAVVESWNWATEAEHLCELYGRLTGSAPGDAAP